VCSDCPHALEKIDPAETMKIAAVAHRQIFTFISAPFLVLLWFE